jgi:hypothetical protein
MITVEESEPIETRKRALSSKINQSLSDWEGIFGKTEKKQTPMTPCFNS